MMMMPFVRLLAIYALVGAAIFAFLKRDDILASINPPEDPAFAHPIAIPFAEPATDAAETQVAPAENNESAKAPEADQTPSETAPAQPSPNAPSAFGTQITPQYFGQAATQAPAAAPPIAPTSGTMVERWQQAREVFSQGKPEDAASLYEALIADFPDNADLHGEVGNLYYNLGMFEKAAIHYRAVGEIAVKSGNRQMAGSMLALLQRISPSQAALLQTALNGG